MKHHFKGYYRSSEEEIRELWASATIVFDANVLLDFHRYEPETSETYLGLASNLSDRLWVPFQAAQEYHENRANVRAAATAVHDDQIDSITKLVNTINQAPRKSHLTAGEKHRALVDAAEHLVAELKEARDIVANRNAPTAEDPVLNKLSELLTDDKIGPKPSEEDLKKLYKLGAERFSNKIPPGYIDAGKKPGNRQYGDFVLWQQVMDYAKENKLDIILVTEDAKEDWWVSAHGKQLMPRPELINEFREYTDGQSIHLYNGLSFFDYATAEVGDKTAPEAIQAAREDLEEVAQQRADYLSIGRDWLMNASDNGELDHRTEHLFSLLQLTKPTPRESDALSLAELSLIEEIEQGSPLADVFARIKELEKALEKLNKHVMAREIAGTDPDDPVRTELTKVGKRIRKQLSSLYRRVGLTPRQMDARYRALGPEWDMDI